MQRCDPELVQSFDYSKLSSAFAKLSKPAKRALINHRIYSPTDLANWTLDDVAALHGVGPSTLPVLKAALRSARLAFR